MAKRARSTELPPDILFDILKLLPFESLCRLRCVSRLWRSIIDDPHFLAAHACSLSRSKLLLFSNEDQPMENLYEYSIDYPQQLDDCCIQTPAFHGNHSWPVFNEHILHQEPFHGLCCANFVRYLQIWNVMDGIYFHVKTDDKVREWGESEVWIEYQIGFDPVEKKHKILSVWHDYSTGRITRNRIFDFEENCWRSARNDLPLAAAIRVETIRHIACIDGFIFYSLHSDNTGMRYLVAFHVRSERPQTVEVPEEAREADSVLTEFDGHAALGYLDGSTITLWILDDVENQVWRRITFTIPWREDYDQKNIRLLAAATPTCELLLAQRDQKPEPFFFFIYNIEHNVLRRIEVQLGLHKYVAKICHYAERRHPLPRFNKGLLGTTYSYI